MEANRFGIRLAQAWAEHGLNGPKGNVHLFAAKHWMRKTKQSHLAGIQLELGGKLHKWEFLVDVFIERRRAKPQRTESRLAYEIEASPDQDVDFIEEGGHDYLHDFTKLLYVRAPRRLFVAVSRSTDRRLARLERTLKRAWRDAMPIAGELAVVLLPPGKTQMAETRLGLREAGKLNFYQPWQGGKTPTSGRC